MLVEYWLAAQFSRAWPLRWPARRADDEKIPEWAMMVARGEPLPLAQLTRVQGFLVWAWWGAALASVIAFFPVIAVSVLIPRGRVGTDLAGGIILVLVALMAICVFEAGLLQYRANRSFTYLLRHPREATVPLPVGLPGSPRRSDFWVAAGAALVLFGTLFAWSQAG
jgi:hypothetical protein